MRHRVPSRFNRTLQGLTLKATSDRGNPQLIVNHLYSSWNLTLHYAFTLDQAISGTRRPEVIWYVRRQQWCLISLLFLCVTTNYYKGYQLKSVKVTLQWHHHSLTPSKQRSRIHDLIAHPRYARFRVVSSVDTTILAKKTTQHTESKYYGTLCNKYRQVLQCLFLGHRSVHYNLLIKSY